MLCSESKQTRVGAGNVEKRVGSSIKKSSILIDAFKDLNNLWAFWFGEQEEKALEQLDLFIRSEKKLMIGNKREVLKSENRQTRELRFVASALFSR